MRMLADAEIAQRIYDILKGLPAGSMTCTSALFRKVKIDPEELLPVDSLVGIHRELISLIDTKKEFSLKFDRSQRPALPQHIIYEKSEII